MLQCDERVQRDTLIQSQEDFKALLSDFSIQGGGSTDFRPAFSYVEELRRQGEILNLGGLLYFTDGKGIYPEKKTDYKTAFLFLDDFEEEKVPSWAIDSALRVSFCPENTEQDVEALLQALDQALRLFV